MIASFRDISADQALSQQGTLNGSTTFQRVLLMQERGFVPWSIFLLMAIVFLIRTAVLHRNETSSTSSSAIERFLKSSEDAHPLWSYSTLYDEDDDRLQKHDAALTEIYKKYAKLVWIEVGVMLFAPHLSLPKLFASPTMRAVIRQQSTMLKLEAQSIFKKVFVTIGKTIKTIYKNRSRYSTLSDYTWYFTIEEEDKKPPTPRYIDLIVQGQKVT